jgi:hypothetical protein
MKRLILIVSLFVVFMIFAAQIDMVYPQSPIVPPYAPTPVPNRLKPRLWFPVVQQRIK